MKHTQLFLLVPVALSLVLVLLASGAGAQSPAVAPQGRPGNYCAECHPANDARTSNARITAGLQWQSELVSNTLSPCPTMRKLQEQASQTGELFGAIQHSSRSQPFWSVSTAAVDRRVNAGLEAYDGLMQGDRLALPALGPVEAEAGSLRYGLGKTFSQVYQGWSLVNTYWAIGIALAISLLLAGTAVWRLRLTPGASGPAVHAPRTRVWPLAVVAILVFGSFALPVFGTTAPTSTTQTQDQARRQEALNAATKTASAAELASARAWMLARIGADWAALDRARGEALLAEGLRAADEFRLNGPAYLGRAASLQESAIAWPSGGEAAVDASDRIRAAASRAWAWRAMAEEWAALDRDKARDLLDQALAQAKLSNSRYYRNVDLAGIALAQVRLGLSNDLAITALIDDPGLRAWALRDIAAIQSARDPEAARQTLALADQASPGKAIPGEAGTPAVFVYKVQYPFLTQNPFLLWRIQQTQATYLPSDPDQALQTARSIRSPYWKVRALVGLGQRLMEKDPARAVAAFQEALSLADDLQDTRPLVDLAIAWAQIDPAQAVQVIDKLQDADRATALIEVSALAARKDTANSECLDDTRNSMPVARPFGPQGAATGETVYQTGICSKALAGALFDRALSAGQSLRRPGDPLAQAEALRALGHVWIGIDPARAARAFEAAAGSARRVPVKY